MNNYMKQLIVSNVSRRIQNNFEISKVIGSFIVSLVNVRERLKLNGYSTSVSEYTNLAGDYFIDF